MTDSQKNARFALAVLFGVNMMNFFDRQVAGALAEPIRLEFGLSDTQLGVVNTVFVLVYAFAGVPLGRLTDSWLRTRLIAIGVTVWSVFTAASGLAKTYTAFLITRIGVGVGEASCAPASQSLIGDLYPPHRRARAMGLFMLGLPLGLFGAYMLSGIIGERWGWRAAFLVACVPGLILAGLVLLIREPARGASESRTAVQPQSGQSQSDQSPYLSLMKIPTLWWIVLSGMLFNFNSYAVNIFQSPFLQRFHEVGLREASNISAVSLGLAGVFGLMFGGWMGDRMHAKRENGRLTLAAICLLLAAPCVFMALQQPKGSVGAFALLMGMSTALTFAYYSTVYSAIQDVVGPHLRGTAVSLYFFAMYVLGGAFGSMAMGALSDFFAHEQMIAAGATEMAPAFKAAGLHSAMHVMPVLMLLCSGSLFGAARTVESDIRKQREQGAVATASV
ncbi:putative MFS family arabinose efflux permease [Povalibacter uvarum]|uniref:Putative MFS family arabinose efflux permease n=1 Tax=Povalibacter uvarum TaxID=732238 RepID=A0A841HN63_9GAMM|nr:MFS transporter [Povalibacter uvarum]MBB6094034.1 putative MFS family arabinose efflux permease [Povalibacter uvarum]